jgi:hypothetical protein
MMRLFDGEGGGRGGESVGVSLLCGLMLTLSYLDGSDVYVWSLLDVF